MDIWLLAVWNDNWLNQPQRGVSDVPNCGVGGKFKREKKTCGVWLIGKCY